eukprot:TRINITY_DN7503_c0_g2_i5.p1 TRINITY_DN7503_c0_g2~~TRINITY_DN7503_c0_g2_i5.p1  ORF type:complete len:197 (-),score=41.66 TRINITY_DN7503_c0_g2_i5:91-681(-)
MRQLRSITCDEALLPHLIGSVPIQHNHECKHENLRITPKFTFSSTQSRAHISIRGALHGGGAGCSRTDAQHVYTPHRSYAEPTESSTLSKSKIQSQSQSQSKPRAQSQSQPQLPSHVPIAPPSLHPIPLHDRMQKNVRISEERPQIEKVNGKSKSLSRLKSKVRSLFGNSLKMGSSVKSVELVHERAADKSLVSRE